MPRPTANKPIQTPGDLKPVVQDNPEALAGMGEGEDSVLIADKEIPIKEILLGAYEASGMTIDEWNALPAGDRDRMFANQVHELTELARTSGLGEPTRRPVPKREPKQEPTVALGGRRRTLPHPDEVNPDEITAPVETTHGWIVPAKPRAIPEQFRR